MEKKLRLEPAEVVEQAALGRRLRQRTARTRSSSPARTRPAPTRASWPKSAARRSKQARPTINLPDTVGYCLPEEYASFLLEVQHLCPELEEVSLSVHCHNDLGLAVANSLAAVSAGATQIEATVNGLGERAGNAALEEIVMALRVRRDSFETETGIVVGEIGKTSHLVEKLTGYAVQRCKAIVGANAFAHEAGIHQDGMLKDADDVPDHGPDRARARR